MVTTHPFGQVGCDGFLCAVSPDAYTLGVDYAHDMTNVFVFHVPLPKEVIIARISADNLRNPEDIRSAIREQLQYDVGMALSEMCLNETIPWNQVSSVAATLRTLDEGIYHKWGVTKRLLRGELGILGEQECDHLLSLLVEGNPAFYRWFLRLYYGEYPFPHFARALMVAGARFVHPVHLLSLYDPAVVVPSRTRTGSQQDDAAVVTLLSELLPRLGKREIVFGTIEMAAMRRFPGSEIDLQVIEDWITRHGETAVGTALYFVRFGGDSFPNRRSELAVRMAVAALRGTGEDHFYHLLELANTDYPVTHFGLIHAFGLMKEERAIPYLASCLNDERKQVRGSSVEALGLIGTAEAINLAKQAAHDPTKVVRQAVQRLRA